jgi:hypothetical protein
MEMVGYPKLLRSKQLELLLELLLLVYVYFELEM